MASEPPPAPRCNDCRLSARWRSKRRPNDPYPSHNFGHTRAISDFAPIILRHFQIRNIYLGANIFLGVYTWRIELNHVKEVMYDVTLYYLLLRSRY